jgi:DNA-binding CsgD family transcriptional regulator
LSTETRRLDARRGTKDLSALPGMGGGVVGIIPAATTTEGSIHRRSIAALVVNSANVVLYANNNGMEHLRLIAPQGQVRDGQPLPESLVGLVDALRDDLKVLQNANSSLLTLPMGLCLRASLLGATNDAPLLLLFEPFSRVEERSLSPREREVATLVVSGLSNREIAARLVLARHTVEGHLKRIFSKMTVRTRAGLVAKMLGWPYLSEPERIIESEQGDERR